MQLCNSTLPQESKQSMHTALLLKIEGKHSLAHNSALGRGSWPVLLIYNPFIITPQFPQDILPYTNTQALQRSQHK